jgi:hypothetical protein
MNRLVVVRNFIGGATSGLVYGVAASALTLIQYAWKGTSWFEARHYTLLGVIAFYLVGSVVAGGIAGSLRKLARSYSGAIVIGFVSCVPLSFAVWLTTERAMDPSFTNALIFIVMMSLLAGGTFACATFRVAKRHGRIPPRDAT